MPGDTIISKDEDSGDVYIILDGEAMVVHEDGSLLAQLTKGTHFGEMALIME